MPHVTLSQFAKEAGIDPSMVTKLKRQGVLEAAIVPPEKGKKRPKLDLKKALKAYRENVDPAFTKDAPQIKNRGKAKAVKKKAVGKSTKKKKAAGKKKKSGGQSFIDARTKGEIMKLKNQELDYFIKKKKYIDVAEVEKNAFTASRILRDNLLNIPIRFAKVIAAKSKKKEKEIYQLLRREINKALDECHTNLAKLAKK